MRRRLALLLAFAPLVACHHRSSSSSDTGGVGPPGTFATDTATFFDVDEDGEAGPGDRIVVTFDRNVRLRANAAPDVFELVVAQDVFGAGATLAEGPGSNQITIVLGDAAQLRTRGPHGSALTDANSPSGLRIAGGSTGRIRTRRGARLVDGRTLDLVPGLVAPSGPFAGPTGRVIATADFDCDGRADFVTSDAALGLGFALWTSQPDFGFEVVSFPMFSTPDSAAAADVDGDGRVNLVVHAGGVLSLLTNTAVGMTFTFVESQIIETTDDVQDLLFADVDADGDLDLLRALEQPGGIWLYANQGGLFDAPVALLGAGGAVRALAAADVDGDGLLDIVAGGDGVDGVVLHTDGCGGFGVQTFALGPDVLALTAADLNADGRADLVAGRQGSDIVLFSGAGGSFLVRTLPGVQPTRVVATGDFDGDSLGDVVRGTDAGLRVSFGDGADGFASATPSTPIAIDGLVLADYDSDGDLDAVVGSGGAIHRFRGSLTGTYGSATLQEEPIDLGEGPAFGAASGDLNGDGLVNLVVGGDATVRVWLGEPAGSFGAGQELTIAARATDVALADLDQDGDLDVVLALIGNGPFIYLNDAGTLVPDPSSDGSWLATAVGVADLEGDGDLDVVLGTVRTVNDMIVRNLGFTCQEAGGGLRTWNGVGVPALLPLVLHTGDLALGDLDCDGDPDMVSGHGPGEPGTLWVNEGGVLMPLMTFNLADPITRGVALADLDRDGDLDAVLGNIGDVRVWRNETLPLGALDFVLQATLPAADVRDVQFADLGGDGAPDLFVGNAAGPIHVWMNDGTGDLGSAPAVLLGASNVRTVLATDLDRDGDPDVFSGASYGGPNRLWVNR